MLEEKKDYNSSLEQIDNLNKQKEHSNQQSKRKKVLLVLPNHHWVSNEAYTMWLIFPTQICLLAGQIEDKYDVKIVDCIIDDLSQEEFVKILKQEQPDVVGCSNFTHEYSKAGHLAVELAKKVNPKVITFMGGVYVITSPDLAIENKYLDYAIQGEGELLIKELLESIYENKPLPKKGLAYRESNSTIVIQERGEFIQNLDLLKYPAYHLIDFLKYATRYQRDSISRARLLPYSRVCMTRGCPIGCTFCCVESITGGPTRYRSTEHMIGEMEMLKEKYGVKFIYFDDDNLFMNKKKAKDLLRTMIDKKLNFQWVMEGAAIFCMDEELVYLCKESGCQYLNFSIESGSPRVLKEIIKKPINFTQVFNMVKLLREQGIDLAANFVIGNPGETLEEIWETIKVAEDLQKAGTDYVKFFICTPFPKTKMFDMAKKMGYLDDSIKFDAHHWTGGTFNTPHWRAKDLAVIRAYEWDRINFDTLEKRQKMATMMDVSLERLDEIRRATRERANPNSENERSTPGVNQYLTTKQKSAEETKNNAINAVFEHE